MILKKRITKSDEDKYITFSLQHEFDDITMVNYSDDNANRSKLSASVKIKGICDSRLFELKKYGFAIDLNEKYWISTKSTENGVILAESDDEKTTYRIDRIKFVDIFEEEITTFEYNTNSVSGFMNKIDFVNDKYHGYIDVKIKNNILINRQNINILEQHYRLNAIKNVNDFDIFGGGYFNVFKI